IAVLRLTRRRQRTERASMKRILQRQQTPLRLVPIVVVGASIGAGKFQRAFPCLGSTVAEEGAVQAGHLRQPLRQFGLKLVIEQVRRMNQLARLLLYDLENRRVCMTKRIDPDSANKIQVALPFRVP